MSEKQKVLIIDDLLATGGKKHSTGKGFFLNTSEKVGLSNIWGQDQGWANPVLKYWYPACLLIPCFSTSDSNEWVVNRLVQTLMTN